MNEYKPKLKSADAARLTCVINVKNGGRFIGETLASLQKQTVPCLVLVVDNQSTDNTESICRIFREVRIVKTPYEMKLGEARNYSLEFVSTEFIAWLDADDLWHPQFVEQSIAALDCSPNSIFVNSGTFIINEKSQFLSTWKQSAIHIFPSGKVKKGDTTASLLIKGCAHWCSEVFRTAAVRTSGGFDTSMEYAEDWDLMVRLSMLPGTSARICSNLSKYRVHSQQGTRTIDWRKRFFEINLIAEKVLVSKPSVTTRRAVQNLKEKYGFFHALELAKETRWNIKSTAQVISSITPAVAGWILKRTIARVFNLSLLSMRRYFYPRKNVF